MKLATVLSGQAFIFRSLKEVLAKANELKSGDVLAGVAASSDLERIAAKEVLSQLLLSDLRNHPVVPYEGLIRMELMRQFISASETGRWLS